MCFVRSFCAVSTALRPEGPVEYIIDAGANIGLASIYLLRRFPLARVIAIEPDRENFEIAKHNLRMLSARCRLVHGAVWSAAGALGVRRGTFGDGRHWATADRAAGKRGRDRRYGSGVYDRTAHETASVSKNRRAQNGHRRGGATDLSRRRPVVS